MGSNGLNDRTVSGINDTLVAELLRVVVPLQLANSLWESFMN